MNRLRIFVFIILMQIPSYAQNYKIIGKVIDSTEHIAIVGASVQLQKDNKIILTSITDTLGNFEIRNVNPGKYLIKITNIKYNSISIKIFVYNDTTLGNIFLLPNAKTLKTVIVKSIQTRAEILGDTAQFNANAYKVHQDATVEELLKKMPGVTTDNSGIKVHGESVKQVLVDGKPFMGNDPSATTKNLPADIIDKVQFYDKLSDQAQFSGFDDGNSQKTINLITKPGKNNGIFGKLYFGEGNDNLYNLGGNYNYFNGQRRISVLGMFNNINQQNFAIDDIMNLMTNSGTGMTPGGGSRGLNPGTLYSDIQQGITSTSALGLNYSDNWSKKIDVTASYFYNKTDNHNESNVDRNYFNTTTLYNQYTTSNTININHRFNMKLDYKINDNNSLIYTPQLRIQNNNFQSKIYGRNTLYDKLINSASTNQYNVGKAVVVNNNLVLQHKFTKKGRTISLGLNLQFTEKENYNTYSSYTTDSSYTDSIKQLTKNKINNNIFGTSLYYTEPISKNTQVLFSYNINNNNNKAEKNTFSQDSSQNEYTTLDTALTNHLNNNYLSQTAGIGYKLSKQKVLFGLGVDFQNNILYAHQYYPINNEINKSYTKFLPNVSLNYKFNKTKNLNIKYKQTTNLPSASQLQDVLDISNPMTPDIGNSQLNQEIQHSLLARYGSSNIKKGNSAFLIFDGQYKSNYIGNSLTSVLNDTNYNGTLITKGAQISRVINLDNYTNIRSFVVLGFPLNSIKSNINMSSGITLTEIPSQINQLQNKSRNYALNSGLNLSSNISKYIDFSFNYSGNYNVLENTLQKVSNNSYYNHSLSFKITYTILNKFVLNTEINQNIYKGLTTTLNQQYYLWNAYIGYKMLKNNALELKVTVNDILKQNRVISRNISETYMEDSKSLTIQRYGLLTLTYTFKNFKAGKPSNGYETPPGIPKFGNAPLPPDGMPQPPKTN